MPKGFKTPPDKVEKVIALAQTAMTQEEIAKMVDISRRQVARIWDDSGIERGGTSKSRSASPREPGSIADHAQLRASLDHHEALFGLASRLRDENDIPLPHRLIEPGISNWMPPWTGKIEGSPLLAAEQEPLYPYVRIHLSERPLWGHLDALEEGMAYYLEHSRRLASAIADVAMKEATSLWPDLWSEELKNALVPSVMLDAYYGERGMLGIEFTYLVKTVTEAGAMRMELKFGAWSVRSDTQEQAEQMRELHRVVRGRIEGTSEVQILAECMRELEANREAFKLGLVPDDRIRKMLVDNRCELCT